MTNRALPLATAGLAGALLLTGCQDETALTEADRSGVPTEELVGEQMTLTNEVGEVYGDEFLTIGEESTVVFVDQMPEGVTAGDTVEVTGTVESADLFTVEDLERLQQHTDTETATYLIDRGPEPHLTGAAVTVVD